MPDVLIRYGVRGQNTAILNFTRRSLPAARQKEAKVESTAPGGCDRNGTATFQQRGRVIGARKRP